jgi:hypothetical protein
MRPRLFPTLAGILAVMLLGALAAAQTPPTASPPPAQAAARLTPGQLDQLTAPIALYPDALVGQILMASTYPLEVVQADRWLRGSANAALGGDQLAAALVQQPWDPSVKSLVAFPPILKMMDGNLTWTEQLGDAFLAGQAAIMDSIQRLREQAVAAGMLKSTPQEVVSNVDGIISIAPPDTNSVYVPVYNPSVVYGTWAYPDYPPDYFPGYFPGVTIGPQGFGWLDVGVVVPLWGWAQSDWRGHRINIDNANRFNALNNGRSAIASGAWQHDSAHRGGVPYRDPAVSARFAGAATASRGARGFPAAGSEAERTPAGAAAGRAAQETEHTPAPGAAGRGAPQNERVPAAAARSSAPEIQHASAAAAARPSAPQNERAPAATARAPEVAARAPAAARPTPPVLASFGRGPDVRAQAQRGQVSRASAPAPRAAAPRAAPAARAAPAGGGGKHK